MFYFHWVCMLNQATYLLWLLVQLHCGSITYLFLMMIFKIPYFFFKVGWRHLHFIGLLVAAVHVTWCLLQFVQVLYRHIFPRIHKVVDWYPKFWCFIVLLGLHFFLLCINLSCLLAGGWWWMTACITKVHYRAWTESTQHKFEDTWHEQQPLELVVGKGTLLDNDCQSSSVLSTSRKTPIKYKESPFLFSIWSLIHYLQED